jgi:hypothetical protein
MGLCDEEITGQISEAQHLLNETKRALHRWSQAHSAFAELMAELMKQNKAMEDIVGRVLPSKTNFVAKSLAEAEKTKKTIDEIIAKAASPTDTVCETREYIVDMVDRIATINKESSLMRFGLQLDPNRSSIPTATIIPVVEEERPTTSVEILGNGQALLAIHGVTEGANGYDCRLLIGDGPELRRSEFSIEGMLRYIMHHREIFSVEEIIFKVLVTDNGETKIARKFGWKSSQDKFSLKSALDYCLFYLV